MVVEVDVELLVDETISVLEVRNVLMVENVDEVQAEPVPAPPTTATWTLSTLTYTSSGWTFVAVQYTSICMFAEAPSALKLTAS